MGGRLDSAANYLGPNHSCSIVPTGKLYCWGSNVFGQLGYGNTSTVGEVDTPAEVGPVNLGPGRTAVAVATGNRSTCVILDTGAVKCWGLNANGELGYGNTSNLGDNETPAQIPNLNLGAGRTATAITGGGDHFCAILDTGGVKCWGVGGSGNLGYGNTNTIGDNETPAAVGTVDIGAGRTAVAISGGTLHTCAILDNGAARCWGHNTSGELGISGVGPYLGDDETPGSVPPIDLGAGRTATAISAGESSSCAILDNGSLRCWGANESGKLGTGDNKSVTFPTSVPPVNLGAGRTAISVSSGPVHTCAVLDNGTVKCWGSSEWGELGYGNTPMYGGSPVLNPASVGTVDVGAGLRAVAITTGSYFTCALLDNARVRCWGQDFEGRLGYAQGPPGIFGNVIGDDETPATKGPVDFGPNPGALEAAAGGAHTCAVRDSGSVSCWGNGASGQLGYGNTQNIGDDENVGSAGPVSLGGDAVEVVTGTNHSCALLGDGTVRCWGLNSSGQLGLGNTKNIGDDEVPTTASAVNLGGTSAIQIAAGANHTCALLADGTVRCWGLNSSGQLGLGNTNNVGDDEAPSAVSAVSLGQSALSISAGGSHTCARLADGSLRCWGNGLNGRLGYSSTTTIGDNELPSGAVSVGGSAAEVAAGGSHTCALLAVGTVRCWGLATSGQLGYGNTTAIGDNETPAAAGPVNLGAEFSAKAVAAGEKHSCAIVVAGYVRCWGLNSSGQLGIGNTNNLGDNELPITVTSVDLGFGRSGAKISAGGAHTCATLDDGSVRCWGLNSSGQLGIGNTNTIGDDETPGTAPPVDFEDDPPVAVGDSATVAEDSGASAVNVLANDTDADGGPKTVESKTNGAHGTVTITGGGSGLTYAPDANYCGPDSFTYTLNGGSTATVSVTVTCVDDPPSAVGDSMTVAEDSLANVLDVLANDTDVDGGAKTIVAKANGAHGTVTIIGGGLSLTYAPDANYCGPDSFTYTLNGGSTATVSVTVTCVDDPPTAVADSVTVAEDASATAIDVLANDSDADGGAKSVADKTNGAHGIVAITGGGSGLTYTPDADYCGPDSFTYTLAPGGATATVTVTVTCVDDPPSTVGDSASVGEDSGATAIDVLANDTDTDGGPKTIQSVTQPAKGTVSITGGGSGLTYAPDANYCNEPPGGSPDTFTYTLAGGSTATVSVKVTCVDDPPVAADDSATLAEDAPAQAIDVLANDTDVDGGSQSITGKTDGQHGTVAITGGGTGLTYVPNADYCGPDSFTYTLNGGSTATVSMTVTCVDDPPSAADDSETLAEDSGANAIGVLTNDADADGGAKSIVSKTNGAHGTVSITGGGTGLTYAPAANYCGPDSFTYTLNGGAAATVSVTVTCVDDPPAAVGDSDTVLEDAAPAAIDVLANDTDVDGGPRAIAGKTNGAHGSVAILGGGAGLTYQPAPDYCGPDSFTYTLNGGSTATVSVTVTCVDEPAPTSGGGGSGGGGGSTTIVQPPAGGSSAPVVNITPGIGVVSGRRHPRVAVKGAYAFFTLTCKLTDRDCRGIVRITANVPSIALGPTMRDVTVVNGRFRVGSGRSVLVRAKLTRPGLGVLKKKRSLRGVAARMSIVDTGNGERGRIQVNLVRRPKASLLPGRNGKR
jgi:alpha-tubulin suppressor-like RCC1 family protein